jgi:hypothetical protein
MACHIRADRSNLKYIDNDRITGPEQVRIMERREFARFEIRLRSISKNAITLKCVGRHQTSVVIDPNFYEHGTVNICGQRNRRRLEPLTIPEAMSALVRRVVRRIDPALPLFCLAE